MYLPLQMMDETKREELYEGGDDDDEDGQLDTEDTGEVFLPADGRFGLVSMEDAPPDQLLPPGLDNGGGGGEDSEEEDEEEEEEESAGEDDGECTEFTYQSDASYSQGKQRTEQLA
jgi:hypothetical protein